MNRCLYIGGRLSTIFLFLFFGSCDKSATIKINPNSRYIVYGEVNNLKTDIQVYDIQTAQFLTDKDLSVQILHSGVTSSLNFDNNKFTSREHISVGKPYELILYHLRETIAFQNILPDSITKAHLAISQSGDYAYEASIFLEIDKPNPNSSIFWANTEANFPSYEKELFSYKFIAEAPKISINQANDTIGVFGTWCFNPPRYKNTYQYNFKRVNNDVKDFFTYNIDYRYNYNNPLFVAYPFKGDVIEGNYVFRIASTAQVKTNIVNIEDTSRVCVELYIYDKDGFPLSQIERKSAKGEIQLLNTFKALEFPISDKNPTTITIGDLASLTHKYCDEIDLEKLLNTSITVSVGRVRTNGEAVSDLKEFTISSFNESQTIKLRLK